MCDLILVTLMKVQPHYSQSSHENVTPSSSTIRSPLAYYLEVHTPSPPSLGDIRHSFYGEENPGVYNHRLVDCLSSFGMKNTELGQWGQLICIMEDPCLPLTLKSLFTASSLLGLILRLNFCYTRNLMRQLFVIIMLQSNFLLLKFTIY